MPTFPDVSASFSAPLGLVVFPFAPTPLISLPLNVLSELGLMVAAETPVPVAVMFVIWS